MPIYEYKCSRCGKVSEILEGVGKSDTHKCPSCGSNDLQKLPTAAACLSSNNASSGCESGTCSLSSGDTSPSCGCCSLKD